VTAPATVIEARGVSHWFGEGALRRQVLANLDLTIRAGEIVLLTGPSGSGKTTLLALVAALRSVQEGSLRVLDAELNGARPELAVSVRRRIGFVFQSHNLLRALTALQNVALAPALFPCAPEEARSRAQAALDAVGLGDRGDTLPRQLSGGQRQRVAVARALVGRPSIVLADEPTASLDGVTGREVVSLLRDLARDQGCAVLLVTHDSRILDVADRILSIEDGRLETAGQTLDRIAAVEAALLGRLPAYVALHRERRLDAELGGARDGFARAATEAQTLIADLERKNLPGALRDRAFSLQRMHSAVVSLESSLREFLDHAGELAVSATLAPRAETFVEAFDTVLGAAVVATGGGELDVELLLAMTEDRGPMMRDIRRSVLESGLSVSLEEQATLFEVTHVFERMTYFLRSIAQELHAGVRSRFE
jgi:putative ABC transport system ATP-binding protein